MVWSTVTAGCRAKRQWSGWSSPEAPSGGAPKPCVSSPMCSSHSLQAGCPHIYTEREENSWSLKNKNKKKEHFRTNISFQFSQKSLWKLQQQTNYTSWIPYPAIIVGWCPLHDGADKKGLIAVDLLLTANDTEAQASWRVPSQDDVFAVVEWSAGAKKRLNALIFQLHL